MTVIDIGRGKQAECAGSCSQFCTCCMPVLAIAGSFDDALRKLEPKERLHQACMWYALSLTCSLTPDLRGLHRSVSS